MIRSLLIACCCLFASYQSSAQTFNGTGGAIPDNGAAPTCFPVTVSGVGNINTSYGLASVCVNITHTWVSDLEISLQAPDGTVVNLSVQEGGSGDNYTNTCFTATATTSIVVANAPFTGNFLPEEPMGTVNNGQNANGTWNLCIQDVFGGFTGNLVDWSLTFNNTPAPPPPVQPPCNGNQPAGNTCALATSVCNFNGYCGNTSSTYTSNTWTQLSSAFCGSLENNSFVTFVASATTASFNVWVFNSEDGNGIQMMFYDGGCGSGAVTSYGCFNQIQPSPFPTVVTATGLTPGNTYYLMFDGYAGDVCDYTIAPINGVSILTITPEEPSICVGQSVTLTAAGGSGTFTWSGPNLNTTVGATVIASPTVTTTYTVTSSDPIGNCPLTKNVTVNVTNTPNPPTVTTPLTLCQNSNPGPLSANGTSLLWYTAATGGTGSSTAPTPSTATVGSTTYYVTQTVSCGESVRVPIVVNVVAGIPAPTVSSPVAYCQNATAAPLTATGNSLLWYTTATGGTGSNIAPTPSTASAGSTTYYVSQTGNCGEGIRASIVVNVTASPAAPTVTSPLTICLNSSPSPLTATGSNLLWYTSSTGGVGSSNAPVPATAAVGNYVYFVSQTANGCESPRASIIVTVIPPGNPPTVTSPVVYCQNAPATALVANGNGLLWYTVPTGGTGSSTAPTPSTTTPGTTTYYVSQTTNCGESALVPINVVVNPIPAQPIPQNDTAYCIGSTAQPLTATGSSLLWYTAPTGIPGVATITPSTSTVGVTTYYVSQTLLGCTSPFASVQITVIGIPPSPTFANDTITYCQGSTAQPLSATGTSILWYTTATGGTGSSTAPTPSTAAAGITTYYATQTLPCGESPRAPIVIVVDTTPTAPIVTTPIVYCQGVAPSILSANGSNLLWYANATGGVGTTTAPTPSTTDVGNTTYYVSATIGLCEGPRSFITVTVNVTPPIPTVTTPVTYCRFNAPVPLTATGTQLLWYTQATGGTGTSTAPTPSTQTAGNTTYYVSQTAGVCEGPRTAIDVRVLATPNIGPDKRDTACYDGFINLNSYYNTTGLVDVWSFNGQPVSNPAQVGVAGTYLLSATNANGCSDTALLFFNIRPPVLANAGRDTIAVRGVPHQLLATGGEQYSWSPSLPLDFPNVPNPRATLTNDQLFVVTAYNSIGCSDKDSVFVRVYDGPTYYLPKAFTPDGDGLNDIFRPIPVGIAQTEYFRIYNRFGNMVFSSNQWLKGWDGRYLNKLQPPGTYVWVIQGTDRNGKSVLMKGTVVLLR